MKVRVFLLVMVAIVLVFPQKNVANGNSTIVAINTKLIDGAIAPFNQIKSGDTVLFEAGLRDYILIRNFSGSEGNPIIFINKNGIVTIDTDHYFGISIQNCRFVRLTGTGDQSNFYGFKITRVLNGAGIGANNLSSDFEIDHVSIENTSIGGIYAKTDPDCSFTSTRGNFTQLNTLIHDNYLSNIGNEGMYIGSTKYFGQNVNCNGKDTLLLPSVLTGVRIYNNIIKYTGWDGIQISSASSDCQVYDNIIMFDSQEEYFSQMSGIMLGGGSKCDCFNNYISSGKGSGIEIHGLGGNLIFNNVIIDAGRSFQPLDSSLMKYGIFVTDISVQVDSSFLILFNDIINPKSDGIRFTSVLSRNNLVASNIIINPGAYEYYERLNTSFTGEDSYVMFPNNSSDIKITNNYFARNTDKAGFSLTDFRLMPGSPLIDAGYRDTKGIAFDGFHKSRIYGATADIGMHEYNPTDIINYFDKVISPKLIVFPNPARAELSIRFKNDVESTIFIGIYNLKGEKVIATMHRSYSGEGKEIIINVDSLPAGIYIYQLSLKDYTATGKFIKVD